MRELTAEEVEIINGAGWFDSVAGSLVESVAGQRFGTLVGAATGNSIQNAIAN